LKIKNHLKLDVHRHIYINGNGFRIVTLARKEICLVTWRHITGVLETTFYHYAWYTIDKQVVQKDANSSLIKPWVQTMQATTTLRCILDKSVDHMPHGSHILASGEKVGKCYLLLGNGRNQFQSLIQSIAPLY
jgi:hypothetical protein